MCLIFIATKRCLRRSQIEEGKPRKRQIIKMILLMMTILIRVVSVFFYIFKLTNQLIVVLYSKD